jgi:hypothetical protein
MVRERLDKSANQLHTAVQSRLAEPEGQRCVRAAHSDKLPPADQAAATGPLKETSKAQTIGIYPVLTVHYPEPTRSRSRPEKAQIHKGIPRKKDAQQQ